MLYIICYIGIIPLFEELVNMNYLSKEFQYATVKIYFYIMINIIDNKKYVGQTCNITQRANDHIAGSKSKNKKIRKRLLYRAISKYGIENFIFFQLPIVKYGQMEANEEEKRLIKQYNTFGEGSWGYNMTEGGKSGVGCGVNHPMHGRKHTKESNEKNRISHLGKIVSKKTRKKIRKYRLGKKASPETREKNRINKSGEMNHNWGKFGKDNPKSQKWRLYFEDGRIIEVHGLQQWCKENGYCFQNLSHMYHGKRKRHKDIIKVEQIC